MQSNRGPIDSRRGALLICYEPFWDPSEQIENIGFAIANNADLELVLPDKFQLIDGKKILDTTIQPREKRTFSLMLCCWNAGVYDVFLRDVSYTDVHGKRFVSSATRGLYVLIQSNKIRKQIS